jgi:hypothetical protein
VSRDLPEEVRRELAYENRGEVVPDSARPVRPRKLDAIQSVRFDADTAARLRKLAAARGGTLSDLLRDAALRLDAPSTWHCAHMSIGGSLAGRPSCGAGCDMTPLAVTR